MLICIDKLVKLSFDEIELRFNLRLKKLLYADQMVKKLL